MLKTTKNKFEKFIKCSCGHGGLLIDYDEQFGGLELSHLQYDARMSWRERLRACWQLLKGRPYAGMVIIDRNQMDELIDHLNFITAEETNDEEQ